MPNNPDNERLLVLLAYGLLLIAPPMGGISAVIGAIIAHVRLPHAAGTIHESHYRNQIRVFWTMLIYALVVMSFAAFGLGVSIFALFWPFAPGWPFWQGAMVGLSWGLLAGLFALLSLVLVIWYYWRLIAGFIRALDDKPY